MDSKTQEFLQKLKDSGNWNVDYDYSEVYYIKNSVKVKITDKRYNSKHLISPSKLLARNTKCNVRNAINPLNYTIKQLKEIHDDEYDYSLVNSYSTRDYISVICRKHGEFSTKLNNHKSGGKCPKCVGGVKKDLKFYLSRFQEIHGDKYDYSKAIYKNSKTPIIIICKVHGEFEQTVSSHLKSNCPKCSGNSKLSQKEIIDDFRIIHGDRYDYSLVEYISSKIKVKIICSKHGVFSQSPSDHKKGKNCPKCVGGVKIKWSDYQKKLNQIHNNKYDYSLIQKSLLFVEFMVNLNKN